MTEPTSTDLTSTDLTSTDLTSTDPNGPGGQGRELAFAEAFVRLADTLVADFDLIDVLHELTGDAVALLPVDEAGLLLADQRGGLQAVSASSERANLVELFQIQADQGPCRDAFHTSTQILAPDLAGDAAPDGRWPRFAAHALDAGYAAVHALPLRLRTETIGALNLFGTEPRVMNETELRMGQALADAATIAVLQYRTSHERERLTEQLQAALTSRVIIEQAKGMLSERGGLDLDEAFTRMRTHARATNQRLADLARAIIEGTGDTTGILGPARPPGRHPRPTR